MSIGFQTTNYFGSTTIFTETTVNLSTTQDETNFTAGINGFLIKETVSNDSGYDSKSVRPTLLTTWPKE